MEHKDWSNGRKVMWSDESMFTLYQSDGRIWVRSEADEVKHPSFLMPTVQTCGGSDMIWGCCPWSGLGSAHYVPRASADLNILNDHHWTFSFLIARAYSKMTVSVLKSISGIMRHYFHTWIGLHKPLGYAGEDPAHVFVQLSHHHNKILVTK